jgi:pimeloyl-[acyl-carrier protein] methyl ester esterase
VKIILLPGLDGTGVLFKPFVDHLPSDLAAMVVSYPVDQALGYAELLPLVLGALPQNEPFVILGESFSGPLALMAAARHPAGLQAVVLCATFVRNPTRFRWKWIARLVHPILFSAYPRFTSAKALLGGYSTDELRQLIHQAISSVDPRVLAHRVREVLAVNITEELRTCPVPVLYLRGTKDLVVPSHNAREIQAVSPSVQVSAISSPHMVLQTQPAACVEVISRFIRGASVLQGV